MRVCLVAVILCGLAFAACADDDDDAPNETLTDTTSSAATATPSHGETLLPAATAATSSATPAEEGMDEFREFATLVAGAVALRDGDFFASRVVEFDLTCDDIQDLAPCAGHEVGAVVSGLPGSAYNSDASGLIPKGEYAATMTERWSTAVSASDDFGPGEPRLAAIGLESTGYFVTYQTLIAHSDSGGDARQTFVHRWQKGGSDWELVGETIVLFSQGSAYWLSGDCSECYDYFELWED